MDEWIKKAEKSVKKAKKNGTLVTMDIDIDDDLLLWAAHLSMQYDVKVNTVIVAAILRAVDHEDRVGRLLPEGSEPLQSD